MLVLVLLPMLPQSAHAAQIIEPLDFIYDIDSDDSGDGWEWVQDTLTLTLNGVDIDCNDYYGAINLPSGSTVVLEGDNRLVNTGEGYGIYFEGNLTIEGPGKLTIDAYEGIRTHEGNLTIEKDATIEVVGYYGISAGNEDWKGNIIITDSTIDITTTDGFYGVFCNGDLTINGSSNITVFVSDGTGIASYGSITINGGAFDIFGFTGGMFVVDDVIINGGNGTIKATYSEGVDYAAVYAMGSITLGTGVTVKGWDGDDYTIDSKIDLRDPWGDGDTATFVDAETDEILVDILFTTTIVATAPTITTASLPDGTVGTAYSQTLAATGDATISWSLDSGSLPASLSLSAAGVISGTPTASGTSTFTVKASNSTGSDTKELSIVVAPVPSPTTLTVSKDFGTWKGSGDAEGVVDTSSSGFIQLLLGGGVIDPGNYTVTEGSTIITLKESYLKTLANDTYDLRAEFEEGYADLTLIIDVQDDTPQTGDNTPQTGDAGNLFVLLTVAAAGLLSILGGLIWRKQRQP